MKNSNPTPELLNLLFGRASSKITYISQRLQLWSQAFSAWPKALSTGRKRIQARDPRQDNHFGSMVTSRL
ncbi:MAG TPA: hypothetical protein VJ436_03900 [Anaerolineales bacterium]|nr:hypothetical protein [Anaerolineales bacterium]